MTKGRRISPLPLRRTRASAGATNAKERVSEKWGTGLAPSPSGYVPPAGATDADGSPPTKSAAVERDSHEFHGVARLHPHQHAALALGAGVGERLAYIRGRGHRLSADVENDVAGTEAALGCDARGAHLGHHHTVARVLTARGKRQSQPRNIAAGRLALFRRSSTRFTCRRQFTEREGNGLILALAQDVEFHRCARSHTADAFGEFP